jgi:hypothetical protein
MFDGMLLLKFKSVAGERQFSEWRGESSEGVVKNAAESFCDSNGRIVFADEIRHSAIDNTLAI